MTSLNLKDFMRKYNLKDDTMNENDLERVFNYHIYSRGSKRITDKGFVNFDNGEQGGTHWTCIYIKDKNHSTLIRLEVLLMNFYLSNYRNQSLIIIMKFKIQIADYTVCVPYTFSI